MAWRLGRPLAPPPRLPLLRRMTVRKRKPDPIRGVAILAPLPLLPLPPPLVMKRCALPEVER